MADRVRIINTDKSISVVDLEFSQVVELTKPLSKDDKDRFWTRQGGDVELPSGRRIWLVTEGV